MSLLDRIDSFGGVAAEADALLADFFVRTSAYQRIVVQDRFIVVGRKGTGKTAIYRKLQEQGTRVARTTQSGSNSPIIPGAPIKKWRTRWLLPWKGSLSLGVS